jgi:hypothetical protein
MSLKDFAIIAKLGTDGLTVRVGCVLERVQGAAARRRTNIRVEEGEDE